MRLAYYAAGAVTVLAIQAAWAAVKPHHPTHKVVEHECAGPQMIAEDSSGHCLNGDVYTVHEEPGP
jgi:hypothetical protein